MRKQLCIKMLACSVFFFWNSLYLIAQPLKITVPDYSYGSVQSQYGTVTPSGVANPGPYGGYSTGEAEQASGIYLSKGFRWWGYPGYILVICGKLPDFDFPGNHGIMDMSSIGCMNPPVGFMGSWGGVIADPANHKIWCLNGVQHYKGPTNSYCIPFGSGQICYPPPTDWGYGDSYGYLREVIIVQSSGVLKKGDPVSIKTTITAERDYEGEAVRFSKGVLFLNKLSQADWWKWGMGREYLKWGDVEDILGTPSVANNMLARIEVNQNNTDDSTVSVVVGDTIILELMFRNSIKYTNAGMGLEEGWIGTKPDILFANPYYARTDTIRKLIKKHGNTLTYDLVSLTTGALLAPLTPNGPNVDEDNDGISDTREKGADGNDSNFDGNSDGIPDYKQANVASFLTYSGGNYVTLALPSGTELSQLKVTDNPSPKDKPADAQFPFGFFDFSIDDLDPGEAITVTLILHNGSSINKYYKYGPTPDIITSHWYEFAYNGQTGAEINGNVISLHFVDGLRGDEDLTANGYIKEPGGPAIAGITGINDIPNGAGITVYPNPADDAITLKLNSIIPGDAYILRIISISGQTTQEKTINMTGSDEEFTIPTHNLPDGIYMISLSRYSISYKSKFIKLK